MIAIQHDDVDIGRLIEEAKRAGTGAIVVFDGIVRDDDISEMELEAYEEVALKELEKIAEDATRLHHLFHVDIVHRIGKLSIGENILIIIVSAGHARMHMPARAISSRRSRKVSPSGRRSSPKTVGTGCRRAPARGR